MKKKVKLLGLVVLTMVTINSQAQMGKDDGSKYGHGEDSVRCITNLSLYREYSRNKDYKMALGYWQVVFDECPKSSKNIYIDGAKIYKSFLKEPATDERKAQLCDTLMLIYDRRIENFGQKGYVRGRQGADLLKYRRNDGVEFVKQGYGYLKEAVNLQGEKTSKAVLPTLLSASITLYNEEAADAKQVIEDYVLVSNVIDKLIAKKPNDSRLKKLKTSLDANFVSEGPGDCDKLVDYFTEEHKTKSNDIAFLQMLTSLLRQRECTESELFFTASKNLHELSPSAESALNVALLARNKGKFDEAITFYQQAADLEQDASKKADILFGMAVAYQKTGNKTSSREAALKAAELKEGFGEPYILVGQLYADSKSECSSLKIPHSIYWVAVDMFKKAKAIDPALGERVTKLVATYSKYYPNKEEAFFEGINEGDAYKVGCWINATTKARF